MARTKKVVLTTAQEYAQRYQRMSHELRAGFNFIRGFDDDRVVTIFGSAQIPARHPTYNEARQLGRRLAENGIVVATGGGPGIMEAANRGAYEVGGVSVGLNIYLKQLERRNAYLNQTIGFKYFFARKVMLAHIAQAYVFFPGGFGTLDEFFELSTLIGTRKIEKKMPVVLIGKKYWHGLLHWLEQYPINTYHALGTDMLKLWHITDSIDEAYDLIKSIPARIKRSPSV